MKFLHEIFINNHQRKGNKNENTEEKHERCPEGKFYAHRAPHRDCDYHYPVVTEF